MKSICLLPYIPMLIKNSPIFQQKKAFYTFTGGGGLEDYEGKTLEGNTA